MLPLKEMFDPERFPQLLVGLHETDDAAIYKINDDLAVIQTLDFFTPVVDDPYDYGAIAAANAINDVYAVGGEVVLALNICGFPKKLPEGVIADILRGGAEKVLEAGGVLAGGHTVDDDEPKYGLAVMGVVHPDRILSKSGAQPGDVLGLSKPLGVGVITTAAKGDHADPEHVAAAVSSMKALNRRTAQIAQDIGVNACTDITGFGLLGHACEMAEQSDTCLHFQLGQLPFLPGAMDYARQSRFPGGACSNEQFFSGHVEFSDNIPETTRRLLYTPETSGGLLLSVPQGRANAMSEACTATGQEWWVIGQVTRGKGLEVAA